MQDQPPASPAQATYIPHDKVAATFVKGGSITEGKGYKVMAGRHDGPGSVEVHTQDTDVFYVLEGTATFLTGGTVAGLHDTSATEKRGTSIDGGQSHQLQKGDVIIIPAGVPHWFKETSQGFLYFVVKTK